MVKGTPSMGQKRNKGRIHIRCRRCGSTSYHKIKKICSSCGFGKSVRLRKYNWNKKDVSKYRRVKRKQDSMKPKKA